VKDKLVQIVDNYNRLSFLSNVTNIYMHFKQTSE